MVENKAVGTRCWSPQEGGWVGGWVGGTDRLRWVWGGASSSRKELSQLMMSLAASSPYTSRIWSTTSKGMLPGWVGGWVGG